MKNTNLFIVLVLLIFNNQCYAGERDKGGKEYPSEILPSIVLSYSVFCSYNEEYDKLIQDSSNMLIKLNSNIDALGLGISTRLAFIETSFIVENTKGHYSGFKVCDSNKLEAAKIPFEELLFVTTPLESFNDQILVIISSISPERTTIMSLDQKLDVDVIYDTFNSDNAVSISSIFNVEVIEPDKFLLRGRVKEKFISYYGRNNRMYILEINAKAGYDLKEVDENYSPIHRNKRGGRG